MPAKNPQTVLTDVVTIITTKNFETQFVSHVKRSSVVCLHVITTALNLHVNLTESGQLAPKTSHTQYNRRQLTPNLGQLATTRDSSPQHKDNLPQEFLFVL